MHIVIYLITVLVIAKIGFGFCVIPVHTLLKSILRQSTGQIISFWTKKGLFLRMNKLFIYEYLFNENIRLEENLESCQRLLRLHPLDSYYILKYYEAVRRLEDFNIFHRQIAEILRSSD